MLEETSEIEFDEEDLLKLYSLILGEDFEFKIIKTDLPHNSIYQENKGREYFTWNIWSYLNANVAFPKGTLIEDKRYVKESFRQLLKQTGGIIRNFEMGDFPKFSEEFINRENDFMAFDVMYSVNLLIIKEKYPLVYEPFLNYIRNKYRKVKVKKM